MEVHKTMTMKKLLCSGLAVSMLLGSGAFATEDLQSQLAAANAKIEELQAQVDLYKPFYQAQIVATYGENGVVWLKDAQAAYDAYEQQYSAYGIKLADLGLDGMLKEQIVNDFVRNGVIGLKAAELNIAETMDSALVAELEAQARASMDYYIDYYIEYYYADQEVTDEMRAEAEAYWQSVGISYEDELMSLLETAVMDAVYDYVTKDITITEAEVQTEYTNLLANDTATYPSDAYSYIDARNYGEPIAYNPEGYRTVKQVLIKFDDEQAAQYSELNAQLTALNEELAALEAGTTEEGVEVRTAEAINADITACATAIEALYSALLPEAEEVISKFNSGVAFDELIAQHNDDPGMNAEPAASQGYTICATETYWDPSFIQAGMSIEEVGQISEPAYGAYGIYILYYLADIPAGPVSLDEIREGVEALTLETKKTNTYENQVAAWIAESNVEYFYENFGL